MDENNLSLIRHVLGVEVYKDNTTNKEYILNPNGSLTENK